MNIRKGILGFVATMSVASLLHWPAMAQELPPSLRGLKNPEPAKSTASRQSQAQPQKSLTPASKNSPTSPLTNSATKAATKESGGQTLYQAPSLTKPTTQDTLAKKTTKPVIQPPAAGETETLQASTSIQAQVDILRTVPLEIKDYPQADALTERPSTASQVLNAIDGTPNLLVHMEALRRGSLSLSQSERDELLNTLFKRQRASENDMMHAFNHGYAQLVFKRNKTGLFFLRKANDRLRTQFSSLAYGMAQVEADINMEDARPEEMTTRKMDAMYKLADAVQFDAQNHQPGFWPSYVRVVEKLKDLPAYGSFVRRDFSLAYLPYGNNVIPMRGTSTASIPLTTTPSGIVSSGNPCDPSQAMDADGGGSVVSQKTVNFGTSNALIQFVNTTEPGLYRVRVSSMDGRPMLSFRTYAKASIVEDLEGDGTFEIVARQYSKDPMNPVLVYRYTPCGFELDKKIFDKFQ